MVHCGLASQLQSSIPLHQTPVSSIPLRTRLKREGDGDHTAAGACTASQRLPGWFWTMVKTSRPPSVTDLDRHSALDVPQLRAGQWSSSAQFLHRIGRKPVTECQQCKDEICVGVRCCLCREEADTPQHILLRSPALMGTIGYDPPDAPNRLTLRASSRLTGIIRCPRP